MEKVVYLILTREKDTFNILYVGDCEKTEDNGFFVQNPSFKTWINKTGSEKFLYLAILPLFDSDSKTRKQIVSKIVSRYKPQSNMEDIPDNAPDYVVRPRHTESEKTLCPCCGSEMKVEQVLEKSSIIK